MSFFELTTPEGGLPVLVEVPHSGLAVPEVMAAEVYAPVDAVLRDSDIYVDRLYEGASERGASMLVAETSRYVVDLNRAADDVDAATVSDHPSPRAAQPRGVVWRLATDGKPVLRRPLSYAQLEERIRLFHRPYHEALRLELERLRALHGHAILVAAHSMPSTGRDLKSGRLVRRADIVPGTRGRTTADARVIDRVDSYFRDAGLGVAHDEPYKGGWTTGHYGRPEEGWHVVQIELNRDLYVDEATREPKEPEFDELRHVLLGLIEALGALEL